MDQGNMNGIDQEQLTAEEKEEQIIKNLTSHNPQAPHNLCYFSFKERTFKVDEQVDNLVFHVQIDGSILLRESEEAQLQAEYKDTKETMNKQLI
jgi:hypothetical protein